MTSLDESTARSMTPSMPCSSPGGDGRRWTAPPRWSPTWPTTASSGWCWPPSRAGAGGRAGAGPWSHSARRASPRSLVNRAAKSVVERQRPEEQLDVRVRTPTSNSFPSGHTLAAFATAVVLPDSTAETAAYVGFAGAVAASRVHLRAHHPSDVAGRGGHRRRPGAAPASRGQRGDPGLPAGRSRRRPKGMGPQGYVLKKL